MFFIFVYAEGIPNDGIPLKDTVTVAFPLTVMFVLLATAGLVFTIVCLAFNFIFRNKKYVPFIYLMFHLSIIMFSVFILLLCSLCFIYLYICFQFSYYYYLIYFHTG